MRGEARRVMLKGDFGKGGKRMSAARTRALLRAILRLLIAERQDAALLYIPRGEAGQRRMIAALLSMRPGDTENPELDRLMDELRGIDEGDG